MSKFVIKTGADAQLRFSLKAGNGQTILASEAYKTKASCLNGIESVKKNSPDDAKYERKKSSNGKDFFNLKATNGQVIGTSELYESVSAMENGISSVKNNAAKATTEEVD